MNETAVPVKRYSEATYNKLNFESVKIGLASPDTIRSWSCGEVLKPETINYRTLRPEKDGLFCEKIFGPTKDYECHCGKYKRVQYKGKVCEKCGVKITKAKVRRERMGHIELACPVSHIWYFKGIPSRIALMLAVSPKELDKVLYYAKYIVIDPGDVPSLAKYKIITDQEYNHAVEMYGADAFSAKMGAEGVRDLLAEIDVEELAAELRMELERAKEQKRAQILKRLEVVDAFRLSGNRPEWMILEVLPVIPPDIRPMVQLDGGRFATSDLNDLYRRVINRNNRLKKLIELGSPEIIVRNEKRMLQEAVDALIDNGRRGRPVTGPNNRPLKSLSDMLKGKQGRFRQNLLGKRVDYSGRSVIVVGPELKIYQCGLPKEMALELFKPFVMKRLDDLNISKNIKNARKMIDRAGPEVWDALEVVIKDHPVMLNRAPTLHRLGIQAFEPVLVEGRAIKLHPLVCTAFNADFDGDQMAVHVPLSSEAQAEARFLMLAANNLLKPSDGKPVTVPTQDMVLGSYYLTTVRDNEPGAGHYFKDENEAVMAYESGDLGLHAPIHIRFTKEIDGREYTAMIDTTLGRVIFNRPVPQDLGFVTRNPEDPESMLKMEVEFLVKKGELGKIIEKCISKYGTNIASDVLDKIKNQGYRYSTISGITVSVFDATIPEKKKEYIDNAEEQVDKIMQFYRRGLLSDTDRSRKVIEVWTNCTNAVANELKYNLDLCNPIHMMIDSGARGSTSQLNQLAGMRGLIANTAGQTIEIPIRSNYREGLSVFEYFIASRGARKGLADTALRTADSGYLTRRLVDVSQEVIIRENDCGCEEGLWVSNIYGVDQDPDEGNIIEKLEERLTGRYLLDNLVDENGELIMDNQHLLTEADAKKIVAAGFTRVKIRSLLTCRAMQGVCRKCYGKNLATGRPVSIGEAVGIIAAQSIGEPGTQLTMRTFHTGGVTTTADITQGLPRVEELFEARKPKTLAILARVGGTVSFALGKKNADNIVIEGEEGRDERTVPYGYRKIVHEGDVVKKGDALTEGSINPHDILEVLGVDAVYGYLIKEVQRTYRSQGVDVNDKHIEVIVRQMMRKVKVVEPGDTDLLPGATIDKTEFWSANALARARAEENGHVAIEATCEPVLLGITKASLATDSFLSAASFQETTRVLTDAAIKGKVDPLLGLKENVIIGKLLPSGTGMKCYSDVQVIDNTAVELPDAE
ncbi:MAG: DNA-directed RNA polymerase subunit beta' [Clostridia bacterium]|nr:DNA-directed RNA polymerase subunit beta' [Clostridia bacterium]